MPAGDIGVGSREIGYLFGQYKRLTLQHNCVITGKSPGWGGSLVRPEATGYGLVYSLDYCLRNYSNEGNSKGKLNGVKDYNVMISGSGNVALYAAEKCLQLGAKVITLSDSNGTLYEPNGFTSEQLRTIQAIKGARGRCADFVQHSSTVR